MFGSDILEVSIGVVFVFVLVSTLCSAMREALEGWLKTRASYLEFGIRELLHDSSGTGLAKDLFTHPLIFGLYGGKYAPGKYGARLRPWHRGRNLPSYIPARSFALALMDLAARGPEQPGNVPAASGSVLSLQQIRARVVSINNPAVQRSLLVAIDSAQNDIDRARENIEAWYDSAMDRVSGWYKRSTQWIIFWIALVIVVGGNINTISIADHLFRHDAVRSAIVSTVDNAAGANGGYEQAMQRLDALHLPIGWTSGWGAPVVRSDRKPGDLSLWNDIFGPLIGWLMTAFAAMLGAPFWFDLLNKIMVIRSTVKPHEKSGEEGSEDRKSETPRRVQVAATPAHAPALALAEGGDAHEDSCGVGSLSVTTDDQLPAADGGVA